MRFQTVISVITLGLLAATSTVANAQTYDVATDFSFTNNPTGIWTYGFASELGGAVTALDTTFNPSSGIRGWESSTISDLGTPAVYRNDSAATFNTVPVGSVGVHPSRDGSIADFLVIRFTVPTTATYTVNAQFFVGAGGNTDAYILLNALAGSPVFSAASTNSNPQYTGSLPLIAGNTVDFVVGTGGDNFFSDTTPVTISLTQNAVAVPEGGTFALLLPALLGGVAIVARRRKTA